MRDSWRGFLCTAVDAANCPCRKRRLDSTAGLRLDWPASVCCRQLPIGAESPSPSCRVNWPNRLMSTTVWLWCRPTWRCYSVNWSTSESGPSAAAGSLFPAAHRCAASRPALVWSSPSTAFQPRLLRRPIGAGSLCSSWSAPTAETWRQKWRSSIPSQPVLFFKKKQHI